MTSDGPKAMFAGAGEWLRTRQALLPGPRTLERLVTDGRQAGDQRLWGQLAEQLPAGTSSALLSLLVVPEDGKRRVSGLERLRRGVFRPSSKGMVAALDRLADLIALGGQDLDVSMVPQRRVIGRLGVLSRCGERFSPVWGGGGGGRKADVDAEASVRLGANGEGGVMGFGDGADDGQAKAEALGLGGPDGG